MQRASSKEITCLQRPLDYLCMSFLEKASLNRQSLVIPDARKTHSGTGRPRGQKDTPTRHGDCRLVPNLALDSSTNHNSGGGIEESKGWGNRHNKLQEKKKSSKKSIAD